MARFATFVTILAATLLPAGCGPGNSASVSGTVTLDDKPLDRGTVTFHPEPDGPLAYGQIGPDGTYTLQVGAKTGLMPGRYAVTVVATTTPDANSGAFGKLLTPTKYGNAKETNLRFEVKPGTQRIDLPLKSP